MNLLYEIPSTFLASGEVSKTQDIYLNKNINEFITVHQNRGNIGDKEPTNIYLQYEVLKPFTHF